MENGIKERENMTSRRNAYERAWQCSMKSTSTAGKSWDLLKYFAEYLENGDLNENMLASVLQITERKIFILNES